MTPTPTPTTSSAALSTRYTAPTKCLLTVADVSAVLGGEWKRSKKGAGTCSYFSDRGAIFAIQPIEVAPSEQQAALADARVNSCDGKAPRDVAGTGGSFVCIERPESGDVVEGNIVTRGYFWLIVAIGTGNDRNYSAQSDAVAALLKRAAR